MKNTTRGIVILGMSLFSATEVAAQNNYAKRTLPNGKTYVMTFGATKVGSDGKMLFVGKGSTVISEDSIEFKPHTLVCENCSNSSSKARISITSYEVMNEETGVNEEHSLLEINATGDEEFVEFGFSLSGTTPVLFPPGAEYTFIGTVEVAGFVIESRKNDPLVLTISASEDPGYSYKSGTGTITKNEVTTQYGSVSDARKSESDGPQATTTEQLLALSESSDAPDVAKIRKLLDAGADVNVTNKYGATPLFMASQNGHTSIVMLLLFARADVNTANRDGATPLHVASQNGHTRTVKILLAAQANANATRPDGSTALSIAKEQGHADVVSLLTASESATKKRFSLPFQTSIGTDAVGSISFKEAGSSLIRISTERPGDYLDFHLGSLGGGMQEKIGTGEGSEIRFVGKIQVYQGVVTGAKNGRLAFRKADDEWVYVSGLGQYEEEGKVTRLGYDRTVGTCLDLLKSDDPILREGGARDLGRLTTVKDAGQVVPLLVAMLKDSSVPVRRGAIEGLGLIGTVDATTVLQTAYAQETDKTTKEYFEEALGFCAAYAILREPEASAEPPGAGLDRLLTHAVKGNDSTSDSNKELQPWVTENLIQRVAAHRRKALMALDKAADSANPNVVEVAALIKKALRSSAAQKGP